MRPSIALYAAFASGLLVHDARGEADEGWEFDPPRPFTRSTASIGDVKPAQIAAPAHSASSRIAAVDGGALVSDADSGKLLLTNAAGALVAQLAIGSDAGLLAYDPVARRAYVADRSHDRIVVVDVGEKLAMTASWKTPAEPYGVALTPDRRTLLVTTIADRTLVTFDAAHGSETSRTALAAEPRGLAIAPDGSRAVIASLATGTLEQVALAKTTTLPRHVALHVAIPGQRARGAFNVAFVGTMAVAPYQLEIPVAKNPDSSGQYGGSSTPPISHGLAWLGADGRQAAGITNVQEPRALAWDQTRDVLYVAGLASDELVAIPKASQVDVAKGEPASFKQRCGADGIALAPDGDVLVWCSFTRSVARFDVTKRGIAKVARGPELVASSLDAKRHEGYVLFHTANDHISGFAGMSCGNCHLDGRADGLSWKIGKHELQTPMLAGRIAGTAPFKWDGAAADLPHSLRATIGRLGGDGLSKNQLAALTAYVETMPAVRAPTRHPEAIARGKRLFESGELGCTTCHDGPAYTDRETHELVGARGAFDTPSLLGLAASAPYFHDGSAATLAEVLRDRGKIHGMSAGATKLGDNELRDLVTFLEAL